LRKTFISMAALLFSALMLVPPASDAGVIEDLLAYAAGGYSPYAEAQYRGGSSVGTNYVPPRYAPSQSRTYGPAADPRSYPVRPARTTPGGYTVRFVPPQRTRTGNDARLASNYSPYRGANYGARSGSNRSSYRGSTNQRTWSRNTRYGGYSNSPYYSYQSNYGYGLGYGYGYRSNCAGST
jgi:hypothetical protein